ncbi:UDP glucuronosyltransferase 5 family, polypeptide G1 isoform X4 [Megalops cyprinoides]|uniref:UDP glucuronosyltransferase 5 family, polypeptide G1 isoform X4 n=1 Tax=Megalops cyprinoides TaxID=118141 RepID=UPI00186492CA|nr:UDP glucuronosyltransferase 5 family, polypeptide G1 isoform X4 [Megalops cyprinoides]
MEVLLKELHSRGHQLTVLRSNSSWYIPESAPHYTSVSVRLMEDELDLSFYDNMVQRVLEIRRMGPVMRFLWQQAEMASMQALGHGICAKMAALMLEDSALMARLRDAGFELVLTDPGLPFGVLLAHYLHLPLVYNVRWMNTGDSHFAMAPSPPSYVPVSGSELGDRMDFPQRAQNLLHYAAGFLQERLLIVPLYRDLLHRHFPPGSDLLSMQRSAHLWLIRSDFVFEFPRPTVPNAVYVGGFQCRPARPLPAWLEEFVQSSGEHGVVVMSLGTLVSTLPAHINEAVAAAFARLPQKVVWRHTGPAPVALGNNTLLLDWLPQNDLLGHPKTRAFLAHGGTNGLYEAIYHGVPVLGLPLLFDQFDNLLRLRVRGAARVLEAATLSAEEVLEALRDVLENPSYRRALRGLSRLHRDRPLPPLRSASFWIEHVLRHGGASHLRSGAYHLPWYSYHSLDPSPLLICVLYLLSRIHVGSGHFVCLKVCRDSYSRTLIHPPLCDTIEKINE